MDKRINITKDNGKLEVTIKAFFDEKKQQMLMIWIILFSICGLAIISQFFEDYEPSYKVFFGVYIAFWLFFEFKVIYAFRWRKYGEEKIIIEDGSIYLIKTIGKRDATQHFKIEDVKKVTMFSSDGTSFISSMNKSYWNINKYQLALQLENSVMPFAIDIDQKESKHLLKELQKFIKK